MAQITQRQITTTNHPLDLGALTLLPGLIATLLTGPGWIRLHLSAHVSNPGGAPLLASFSCLVDGVAIDADDSVTKTHTIPATSFAALSLEWFMRLGSGSHVFQITGLSSGAGMIIVANGACMSLWDVGY
jgi:hypothetical protein